MIKIELKKHIISKKISFAVSYWKYINFAFDYDCNKSSASTSGSNIRICLVKLIIQLEKRFVD